METTGKFEGVNHTEIFFRHRPAIRENGRAVIVHGLGEHSGRYPHVAEVFHRQGISCWAPDHRGHGQSQGRRGHVQRFSDFLDDLERLLKKTGPPVFLVGHSLGGLIAMSMALRNPEVVQGLILSCPALGVRVKVPPVKKALAQGLSCILPGLQLRSGLDPKLLSHDFQVVEAYTRDPLVHDLVSARLYTEFIRAMEDVRRQAPEIRCPLLMQIAEQDGLVCPHQARGVFERLGSKDKTLFAYSDFFHEIYNERPTDRTSALEDLETWLKARI